VKTGHEPVLFTWCEEHTRLGFEAHLWSEAFPFGRWLARPGPLTAGRAARTLLIHLPAVLWGAAIGLVHLLSAPVFAVLRPSSWGSLRFRAFGDWPSLVDRTMLLDALVRVQWSPATPRSRNLLARWFGPFIEKHPVPNQALEHTQRALDGADVALIAEGADDPIRERLVLFCASRAGVPCIRVPLFTRDLGVRGTYPAWLVSSSFPALLPLFCRGGAWTNRASFVVARVLAALLTAGSEVYGIWHRCVNRTVLHAPTLPAVVNSWLSQQGSAVTDWPALLAPDYLEAPVLRPWSPQLVAENGALGFWRLPRSARWTASAELMAFLEGPGPVVFVSRIARSAGFQPLLAEVLPRLPTLRLVVTLPPEEALPSLRAHARVYFAGDVPHDWLLERVAAAVHHGGAGTTSAALHAGLPTLVLPTWGDQTLWGQRVHAVGAGPEPIPIRWLTARSLERGLRALVEDATLRDRAREWRGRLAPEDGTGRAIMLLEQLIPAERRRAAR
jgi:hypothetical protein